VEVDQGAVLVEDRQLDIADEAAEINPCHDRPPPPRIAASALSRFRLTVQLKYATVFFTRNRGLRRYSACQKSEWSRSAAAN
jgi:hypothetical protein